ncbi:hypothetical protein DRO64_04685 [Candidatus Bathyarchaeota archaeon]|nr:MAG: hypothetical protein DRO64_04685 [Candidatus Bathyarchaeota archaeon]
MSHVSSICRRLSRPFNAFSRGSRSKNAKYIIDGQQRLTSLLLMKRGCIEASREEIHHDIHLYFHPFNEEFTLDKRKIKSDRN